MLPETGLFSESTTVPTITEALTSVPEAPPAVSIEAVHPPTQNPATAKRKNNPVLRLVFFTCAFTDRKQVQAELICSCRLFVDPRHFHELKLQFTNPHLEQFERLP